MRLFAFASSIFAGLYLLCASDVTDLHPPWDAIKLVSFNQGSAADRAWLAQTPTVGVGVTFPAGYRTADFSGASTAEVTYPDNDATETVPLTVCAWIRIDAYTSFRAIISKNTQSGGYFDGYRGWMFYYGPGISRGLSFNFTENGTTKYNANYTASGDLAAGAWYHVAATCSTLNSAVILYVNGVSKSATQSLVGTLTTVATTEPLRLAGKGSIEFTNYHDGGIDDVRIYSRVLTANEIGAIYAEGIGVSRP